MFNPNNINVVRNNRDSSFVGIKRDPISKKLAFHLPIGFDKFPDDDFTKTKDLFRYTYRTLRKFVDDKKRHVQNNKFDGFIEEDKKGFRLENNFDEETSLQYSKLVYFDSVLDAYDDFLISSLQEKLMSTQNIDYSQIHRYLHKAIYLKNDVIFIDQMELPNNTIQDASTELVELFCYIYLEIKVFLEEPVDNLLVGVLSQNFIDKYLGYQNSIFNEETSVETLSILKDRLLDIEQYTHYKDQDFWRFYEAVETFLYGELDDESEGNIVWGIDKFSAVWEELCYAYAEQEFTNTILYADRSGSNSEGGVDSSKIFIKLGFNSPFKFKLNELKPRYIRPDLLIGNGNWNINNLNLENIYDVQPQAEVNSLGRDAYWTKTTFTRLPTYANIHRQIITKIIELKSEDTRLRGIGTSPDRIIIPHRKTDNEFAVLRQIINDITSSGSFILIDYKYVNEKIFNSVRSGTDKLSSDTHKQLIYELALSMNFADKSIQNEFWIPAYADIESDNDIKTLLLGEFRPDFIHSEINVFQLNFQQIQKIYLSI